MQHITIHVRMIFQSNASLRKQCFQERTCNAEVAQLYAAVDSVSILFQLQQCKVRVRVLVRMGDLIIYTYPEPQT